MAAEAKPFQRATIEVALKTLTDTSGPRRFLVADEVGLGKTVVARGIVEAMSARKRKPLSVLYVCSNLTIAAQNLSRLVGFLDRSDRASAVCKVDRPSLLVTQQRPTHERIHIYSLTPDTAIPSRSGRGAGGRKEERALAYLMLAKTLPGLPLRRLRKALLGQASPRSFKHTLDQFRSDSNLGGHDYRVAFAAALRDVLGLLPGQHLPPRIEPLLREPRDLARIARAALALASLNQIEPDLVVFDEFQRFSDLVHTSAGDGDEDQATDEADAIPSDHAASRVLDAIRGQPRGRGPALLLLSATPYEPFRGRAERSANAAMGNAYADEFFELIEFLAGGADKGAATRKQVCDGFSALSEELRKGLLDSASAQRLREKLHRLLFPLMARTERPNAAESREQDTSIVEAELLPADLVEFRKTYECFEDASWVLPLWQSVPLPMQTLGHRYVAWKNSRPERSRLAPALTKKRREDYVRPEPWPHPRLRELLRALPNRSLALPWVAPSVPWWPMGGGWKARDSRGIDGKLLVFSRFRAVPPALSGLISYSLETELVNQNPRLRKQIANRQWLQPDSKRAALLELFYPSPFLAKLEPREAAAADPRRVVAHLVRQLRARLQALGVSVGRVNSRRPPWRLMLALDQRAGYWERARQAWKVVLASTRSGADPSQHNRLGDLIDQWDEAAALPIDEVSNAEVSALAALALESPSVALYRALARHWPELAELGGVESSPAAKGLGRQERRTEPFTVVLALSWRGLRNYLDSPWFAAALGASAELQYPTAIRNAVVDGNLEAVLDEHFWFMEKEGSDTWPERLANLEAALRLRDASVTVHEHGPAENGESESVFRLGCHVAVPLTEAKIKSSDGTGKSDGEEQDLRPDLVRRAFNTPFWPKVLVTTSVGQEGLDFHPWCQTIAHWDLANGPVALEQREGRITRFAGLAVRRVIAERLAGRVRASDARESPWTVLSGWAEDELSDPMGMSPWWMIPEQGEQRGSSCRHMFVSMVGSELRERHIQLAQERALYRLVLGMPDQADLLAHLSSHAQGLHRNDIRRACLNLSAFDRLAPPRVG